MKNFLEMTATEQAKEIKNNVEFLVQQNCGCVTIKLDSRLAICIGWTDKDIKDTSVLCSAEEPNFGVVIGLKVWTSDDLRTDFDFINYPYRENGEVYDISSYIMIEEDYVSLTKWLLQEYEKIKDLEMTKEGRLIE